VSDIASYLESQGGRPSAGANWVMDCPFCGRAGHLYCTVEDTEDWDGKKKPAGVWICFGCSERSRDFAALLAEFEGCTHSEARATVGRWKLGKIKLRPPSSYRPKADPLTNENWLPPEYEPTTKVWPKYLTLRDITRETAAAFKLGVCRTHIPCEDCKPRGGCARDMRHRIILPIECPAGRSFQARAIDKATQPRYLSGESSGQLLFGWHTVEDADSAVIVEGPFDALKVAQAGLPTVALMGKDVREQQLEMLRMRRRRYTVALDPIGKDAYAIDSACKLADILDANVVVDLDTDPGDANEGQIIRAVNRAIPPIEARKMALSIRLAKMSKRRR